MAVETFVLGWAAAWSRQDVDAYLAQYASDFSPPDGASRAAWASGRRERLTRPKSISVEIRDLEVTVLDGDRAQATFEQGYRASHYRDQTRKTLDLQLEDGAWKILREQSAG